MSRGPAAEPIEKGLQKDSWRARQRAKRAPVPPGGEPDCPEWLAEAAKAVWLQLVDELNAAGTLRQTDGNAMARYCVLWVWWRRCVAHVEQYGRTYPKYAKHRDGEVVRVEIKGELRPVVDKFIEHPEVGLTVTLGKELLLLEREFGLTPAARARIQVQVPPEWPDASGDFRTPLRTVG